MIVKDLPYFVENFSSIDSDNVSVYYDFAESGDVVPSQAPAAASRSGEVNNYNVEFNQISGRAYLSGDSFISIRNMDSGVNPENGFTLLTVFEKAAALEMNIISSVETGLVNDLFAYKGFNFGSNTSNKLYFQYFGQSGPQVLCSNLILPAKSLAVLGVSNSDVTMGVFDPINSTYEAETFPIDGDYLFYSSNWQIGKSNAINYSEEIGFTGFMDDFILVNENLDDFNIGIFISGLIYSAPQDFELTGSFFVNEITGYGYENVFSYTGVTGYQIVETGVLTDVFGNSYSGVEYIPLSGGATGLQIVPLTGLVEYNLITGGTNGHSIDLDYIKEFGFDNISLLADVDDEDLVGLYYGGEGRFAVEGKFDKISELWKLSNMLDNSPLLYLNGLFQASGDRFFNGDIYNPSFDLENDYFYSGGAVYSTGFFTNNDRVIYDDLKRVVSLEIIKDFSHEQDTGDLATNLFAYHEPFLFFNGQKLNSGTETEVVNGERDFFFDSNQIMFSDNDSLFDGAVGDLVFFDLSGISGRVELNKNYFNFEDKIAKNNAMLFLNGVRQDRGSILFSSKNDLIKGSGVFDPKTNVIYNNDGLFFE
jgi:hypothetical protein